MYQTRQPSFTRQQPAMPTGFSRLNWLWPTALGLLTTVLGVCIVENFSNPLSDGNDTDVYEYVGYFFGKNLSLWPWPQLNLINDQTFYPYGTNQVFLDWGFERDYWYTVCSWLFGSTGAYIQYYYVYSLVVTAVGTFLLLRPRFGVGRSIGVGLIVSVFNFYAIYKFPLHLNVCVAHWTTLCIVATYRLLYDVLRRTAVSLPYVLVWVWLHLLVLGQELAYVAGFALTFTTLTLPVLAVGLWRWADDASPAGRKRPLLTLKYIRSQYLMPQYKRHGGLVRLLIGLMLLSGWLYLPLTVQIAVDAWRFDFGVVPPLPSWSHPARLLLPHLPGLDAFTVPYQRLLRDTYESYGQGSPGLYLTLLAGVGFWQMRRRVALWLPVVLMLALCLLYHPVLLPTLKLFPWFSFNRHGGRASLVYPVLFCLLALSVRWPTNRAGVVAVVLLGLLTLSEWAHGFHLRTLISTDVVSNDLLRYCATIKKQPGVAVLDWPFCAVGADGVGVKEGLCPYYTTQNAIFTFRRFYDKKGVGQYFGRLHPHQIQPFLRDGWPRLLTPGRAFTGQDWQFVDRFLRTNQFAGINLYLDLLTPEQVAAFYRHYGQPIAETRFPAVGRVVFIPLRP